MLLIKCEPEMKKRGLKRFSTNIWNKGDTFKWGFYLNTIQKKHFKNVII